MWYASSPVPKKPHLRNLGCLFVIISMLCLSALIFLAVFNPAVWFNLAVVGVLAFLVLTPVIWFILYWKGTYG